MAEKAKDEKEKEVLDFVPLLELLKGVAGPSDRKDEDLVRMCTTRHKTKFLCAAGNHTAREILWPTQFLMSKDETR